MSCVYYGCVGIWRCSVVFMWLGVVFIGLLCGNGCGVDGGGSGGGVRW